MDRVTLITGANGGVGGFIASHLLSQGHRNLVMHYRGPNQNIAALCKKYELPLEKQSVAADLTNESDVQNMVEAVHRNFGPIECLANVAGVSKNAMSWKISKQEFSEVIEGNLMTAFLCSRAVIPAMREGKFGRIVNFSSIVGFTGIAGASHYCAAKAGLIGLTKALAAELASKGITVNAVALGYFNAGLIDSVPEEMRAEIKKKIPLNRFGELTDIGSAIKYLFSDEASFYTGQVLHLNGGQY